MMTTILVLAVCILKKAGYEVEIRETFEFLLFADLCLISMIAWRLTG